MVLVETAWCLFVLNFLFLILTLCFNWQHDFSFSLFLSLQICNHANTANNVEIIDMVSMSIWFVFNLTVDIN